MVKRNVRSERARELLANFNWWERRDQRGRALSKGLKQRLMICMALVSEPQILFLDEPTSGLDVESARLIRDTLVRMNRNQKTTVFLTTHNIAEAEEICQRIGIIKDGRIAAIDTPEALRSAVESRRSVEVFFMKPPVIVFGIIFPIFFFLAFAVGRPISVDKMVPGMLGMALFFRSSAVGPLVTPW